MIDLHCHFLPAVDDGPLTMAEALALATYAAADGITHAVLTPHIHLGRYENRRSSLQDEFVAYKSALRTAGIPLSVSLGGEMRLCIETLQLLQQGEVPMLGKLDGFDILLLEFPHSHILPGTEKLVDALLRQNIRPLLAHPERNKDVLRSIDKLTPFIERGCMLQLTAGSLCGNFGKPALLCARALLERGWVSVLATDAHNLKYRPPALAAGRAAAEKLLGAAAAHALVFENPAAIVGTREAAGLV